MPSAAATTQSVNSSREPVRATCHNSQGNRRRPPTSISAMKSATCARVIPSVTSRDSLGADSPADMLARGGSSTSTSTITRSSTTSQPTAMRPLGVSSTPRLSSAFSSTTVLATESARPNTIPAIRLQPQNVARPQPMAVAVAICTTAPGRAIFFTDIRSSSEKCRPTPNISSITPISASWPASAVSAMKPGVWGPSRMPASK